MDGRWIGRDIIEQHNLYDYVHNSSVNSYDYLGLKFVYQMEFKPVLSIIRERNRIAYTGPIYSTEQRQGRFERFGIMTKIEALPYRNCYKFTEDITILIKTIIPSDMKASPVGFLELLIHETNRAKVYKNIYESYFKKIEGKVCKLKPNPSNQEKMQAYLDKVIGDILELANSYALQELGDNTNKIGIDKDNQTGYFITPKKTKVNAAYFMRSIQKNSKNISKFTFLGFKNMHVISIPPKYKLPSCPKA